MVLIGIYLVSIRFFELLAIGLCVERKETPSASFIWHSLSFEFNKFEWTFFNFCAKKADPFRTYSHRNQYFSEYWFYDTKTSWI